MPAFPQPRQPRGLRRIGELEDSQVEIQVDLAEPRGEQVERVEETWEDADW